MKYTNVKNIRICEVKGHVYNVFIFRLISEAENRLQINIDDCFVLYVDSKSEEQAEPTCRLLHKHLSAH